MMPQQLRTKLKFPGHPKVNGLLCKCEDCRAYQAERSRVNRRNRAMAEWGVEIDTGLVSSDESRNILLAARRRGLSGKEMMRLTGLGEVTVYAIMTGNRKLVARKTANAIEKALGQGKPRELSPGQRLPIDDHRWKLYCLMAQGWSLPMIRDELEKHGKPFRWCNTSCLRKDYKYWLVSTVQTVDWLVEHYGDRHGPSTITKSRMQQRGIFPHIHYTEDGKLIHGSLTTAQKEIWKRRVR